MKKILLGFLFFLIGGVVYAQSSALAHATVNIVPAVGTSTIAEEALALAESMSLKAVQTKIISSAVEGEAESIHFRVVSNAAVYAISVLPFPVFRNFVQQKNSLRKPAVSIKTVPSAIVNDVYTVSVKDDFSSLVSTASTPVAPLIVVHFN
jgi:hypothetical protein